MDNNTKYQNALVYILLGLTVLLYIGLISVAWLCYLPYSFGSFIPGNMFKTLWSFMVFPTVAISITLFMANILNKKLSNTTIVFMLMGMLFFSLISFIYGKYEYTKASYFTSPAVFFLVSGISFSVFSDIFRRKAKKKPLWVIAAVFITVFFGFYGYVLVNYTVLTDLLAHPMLLLLAPCFSLLAFFVGMLNSFAGLASRICVALCYGVSAYGVMYIAFPFMYHRPLRLIYTVGVIVCGAVFIYDTIKFITYKEKKENDC
ncbi:MAG: hypothetical protein IKU52_08925 [Clostridia bacterium]|nr:hypothetical protein [Clostridia bacterium]